MPQSQPTDHPLERLVFFSDAVFAIAITLLVIEIEAPHLPYGSPDGAYGYALLRLIPSFVGYVISFAVIGAFWAGHHRTFATASRYDAHIVVPNLALLGLIAFMPFVTAFMSANTGARVPTVFYCGAMLATALVNMRVVRIATAPPMVDPGAPADELAYARRRSRGVALGAASALALSLIVPQIAQAALMTIPLWQRLLHARSRRGAGPRTS